MHLQSIEENSMPWEYVFILINKNYYLLHIIRLMSANSQVDTNVSTKMFLLKWTLVAANNSYSKCQI